MFCDFNQLDLLTWEKPGTNIAYGTFSFLRWCREQSFSRTRHQTCTPCLKGGIISSSLPEMGNWPSYLEGKSFPVLRQSLGSSYLVGENLPVLGSCSSNMWIYYPWALPDAGCHMASAAKFVNNSASPTIKEFPKINWTQAARAGARGTFWLFHVTS